MLFKWHEQVSTEKKNHKKVHVEPFAPKLSIHRYKCTNAGLVSAARDVERVLPNHGICDFQLICQSVPEQEIILVFLVCIAAPTLVCECL